MAPITALLHHMGHSVTGSDQNPSDIVESLRAMGVPVTIGADFGRIPETAAIVRSTAVPDTHPEVDAAIRAGRTVRRRADALAGITSEFRTIAVAGTHGKTTTSSMIAAALLGSGISVSSVIGGRLLGVEQPVPGAVLGQLGGVLVAEADESDGTFVELKSSIAVVTNIEADHLEYYGGEEGLYAAFDTFLTADHLTAVVACGDDPGVMRALRRTGRISDPRVFVYGRSTANTVRLTFSVTDSTVTVDGTDYRLVPQLPGLHNALNMTAAIAAVVAVEGDVPGAIDGLNSFAGVGRRFEVRGCANDITVVDDYAHLNGEIIAAISAARDVASGRVIVAFQPHRFSRTAALWETYAPALAKADAVVITDIYPSGEAPRPGVSADLVAGALRELAPDLTMVRVGPAIEVPKAIAEIARPGDYCLLLSAGDLPAIADQTLRLLSFATGRGNDG
ncbi:MAG: UDP-N-acetylmuramate--L-alanine ligase [Acidimicrobiales bacterium]|nr:UDP-N-acetylmuramate--L-alanine ligase [Acidimicrobiales bacterium]